jgi:hypothetical protein
MKFENKLATKRPRKNLIPPLTNSNWQLHANATVLDDYSLTMNATASGQWTSIDIPIEKGKTYIFSHDSNVSMYIDVRKNDTYRTMVQSGVQPRTPIKVTHPDAYFIRVAYGTPSAGSFYAKNMQLEEGSVVTEFKPYEEINRVSSKNPSTNLINSNPSKWEYGSADSEWKLTTTLPRLRLIERIKVEPSTLYTVKVANGYQVYLRQFPSLNLWEVGSSSWRNDGDTITTESSAYYVGVIIRKQDDSPITVSDVALAKPMLAKGVVAENIPYREVNKQANLVPSDNLVPPFSKWNITSKFTINSDTKITGNFTTGVINSCDVTIPVEAGKTYTVTGNINESISRIRIGRKSDGGYMGIVSGGSYTFVAPEANILLSIDNNIGSPVYGGVAVYENIQIREGNTPKSFVPYREVAKLSNQYELTSKNLLPPMGVANSNITEQKNYSFLINSPDGGYSYTPFPSIVVKPNTQYVLSYEKELLLNDCGVTVETTSGVAIVNLSGNLPYTFNTGNNTSIRLRFWRVQATGSKIRISNWQLEEGVLPTPFEPYKKVVRKTSVQPKAVYKNYPFTFERASAEVLDGVQYGLNQPRFKNGSLFIETGIVNLLGGKNVAINQPSTQVDLGDRIRFTATGASNYSGCYMSSTNIKSNTTYTLSAKYSESEQTKGKLSFVIEQTDGEKLRVKPKEHGDRRYYTFTSGASVSKVTICFYLDNAVVGDYFELYKDIQLEEKPIPTTYTSNERKVEKVYIPSEIANTLIDTVKGSVEINFSLKNPSLAISNTGGGFFLFDSNADRMFSNFDTAINALQVSFNKLGVLKFDPSIITYENKLLVEWSDKTLTATLNGVSVSRTSTQAMNYIIGQLSLGSRYSLDIGHLNDSINSFIIKDRNGKVKFSI